LPENAAQIRLDALATSFLEPLQAVRGKNRFFISSSPTSLDCLALGYLSLALLPDLPSPWLANCIRRKFPQLSAFVHELQKSFFGGTVSLEDAYLISPSASSAGSVPADEADREIERIRRARGKGILPWSPPDRGGIAALGGLLMSNIADSIPLLSQFRQTTRLKRELQSMAENEEEMEEVKGIVSGQRKELLAAAATVVLGVGMFVGYTFYYGILGRVEWGGGGGGEDEVGRNKWGGSGRGSGGNQKGNGKGASGDGEGKGEYGFAQGALLALGRQMDFGMGMGTGQGVSDRPLGENVDVEVEVETVASM
jgi:sorting and assembly machinery component 37